MATQPTTESANALDITVRPLQQRDLAAADRVMRVAFGTFKGLADPESFGGDTAIIATRWAADPQAACCAEMGGEIVGSNFAANWGSVGFFGPLTVRPDLWDRGIGQRLMEPVMALFERWGTRHAGLFTFASSPKHHCLYQKYGFWPRYLTMLMTRAVDVAPPPSPSDEGWSCLSDLPAADRERALTACRALTAEIYDGLDLSGEIRALESQRLGRTLLLWDGADLTGLAVCHMGAGTEAGSNTLYVKFGAVRPGPDAARDFARLLAACERLAAQNNLTQLLAGINTSHQAAYRHMMSRGFRIVIEGVTMHRGADNGYHRPEIFAIDDWR